jgi:hypothetical protein
MELGSKLNHTAGAAANHSNHPTATATTSKAAALLLAIKQHCRAMPAAARHWWRMQPKGLLLLVAVSFALCICLTGALALLRKCSVGWLAVQLAFAAASVALTVAATWMQWRQNSGTDSEVPGPKGNQASAPADVAAAAAGYPAAEAADMWQLSQTSSTALSSPFVLSMIIESSESSAKPSSSCSTAAGKTGSATAAALMPLPSVDTDTSAAADSTAPVINTAVPHPHTATCAKAGNVDTAQCSGKPGNAADNAADNTADATLVVASPYAEIQWTRRQLLYFPLLMFAAGAFSGLLGAAPNTLFLAPYLMMAGCHPQVSLLT